MDELVWIMLDLLFTQGFEVSDTPEIKPGQRVFIDAFKPAPSNKSFIKGRQIHVTIDGLTVVIERGIKFSGNAKIPLRNYDNSRCKVNVDLADPESIRLLEKIMR